MSVQIDGSTGNIIAIKADYSGDVSIGGTLTYEDVTNIDAVGLITARNGIKVDDLGVQVGTGATIDGATNTLTFLTNGSERLRVTSAGNVGVGTNLPTAPLAVMSSSDPEIRFGYNETQDHKISWDSSKVFLEADPDNANGSSALGFKVDGTEAARFDSSGNFGIGESSPTRKLVVTGDTNTVAVVRGATNGTSSLFLGDSDDEDIGALTYNHPSNYLSVTVNASERMRIASDGDVGVGLASPNSRLHVKGGSDSTDNLLLTLQSNGVANDGSLSTGLRLINSTSDSSVHGGEIRAIRSSASAAALTFSTYNGSSIAEALRIDSSGRLLVGNTSSEYSDANLQVANTSSSTLFVYNSDVSASGQARIALGPSNKITGAQLKCIATEDFSVSANRTADLTFETRKDGTLSEQMRIDSSGRLLIATSSSQGKWNNSSGDDHIVQIESTSAFSQSWISHSTSATAGVQLDIGRSRGSSDGATTVVNDGDLLGHLCFQGADGSQFVRGARIAATVDGTPGADDMPTSLTFETTSDGQSSPSERMRIRPNGKINIGTAYDTSPAISVRGVWGQGVAGGMVFYHNNAITSGRADVIYFNHQGTLVGEIDMDNNDTAYRTTSDSRLKENQVAIPDGIERVKRLSPYRFNWISTPAKTVDGFFAHEVQTVVPEAVSGSHNAVDDDNNPVYQGIDQAKLVPLLTAALQEAIAKIETLETKVAALEG